MQQTRPRLESSHVNTEYVRKEEEEEEEEKEEERKEEGRSWRCARKTRTPHKGCGEKHNREWRRVSRLIQPTKPKVCKNTVGNGCASVDLYRPRSRKYVKTQSGTDTRQ